MDCINIFSWSINYRVIGIGDYLWKLQQRVYIVEMNYELWHKSVRASDISRGRGAMKFRLTRKILQSSQKRTKYRKIQ